MPLSLHFLDPTSTGALATSGLRQPKSGRLILGPNVRIWIVPGDIGQAELFESSLTIIFE
jgi:hypothetical protein